MQRGSMKTSTGSNSTSWPIWTCAIGVRISERLLFKDLARRSFFARGWETTTKHRPAIKSQILRFLITQSRLRERGILEKTDSKSSFRQRLQPSSGKRLWQSAGNLG